MVKLDLALQARGDYRTLREAARFCEERELVAMALPDHYLASRTDPSEPAYDALAQLSGLARETSTLELSTLVSPITFRHPAVTLKMAATIDEMSDGRFTLGLGTGWFTEEHELFGIPFPERRFDLLEEALAYTRAGLEGRPYEGSHYRIDAFEARPKPSNLRIVVGGSGPRRTPELAGRFADEFNVYCGPLDEMTTRIELARAAAERAGRNPDALMISTAGVVITGTTDAAYRTALEAASERFQRPPDELESSMRERGTPVGRDAAEIIDAIADLGVERFYLQMFGTDPERREDMLEALRA
jgi:alkanesulfonate monooxygenase SsuD/methylene tetrahydromethanopterin reductase-like flavin-dependent oxidoreductase (luciferase family)